MGDILEEEEEDSIRQLLPVSLDHRIQPLDSSRMIYSVLQDGEARIVANPGAGTGVYSVGLFGRDFALDEEEVKY